MVPPSSNRISRVPPYLIRPHMMSHTGLSPISPNFPDGFAIMLGSAGPRSLAATNRVSFDVLSSGYLDVSVPRVRFLSLCIQDKIPIQIPEYRSRNPKMAAAEFLTSVRWVSPFGNPRIKGYSHLPTAYRSVSRPSSPLSAKAFTKCP